MKSKLPPRSFGRQSTELQAAALQVEVTISAEEPHAANGSQDDACDEQGRVVLGMADENQDDADDGEQCLDDGCHDTLLPVACMSFLH